MLKLASYLDEFVIGQEQAKKVLSVACVVPHVLRMTFYPNNRNFKTSVYNHYNRVRANLNSLDNIRPHDYSEINLDEGVYLYCAHRLQKMKHSVLSSFNICTTR
jgi:ATP-dependent protease Clp ATPase subunit